MLRDAAGVRLMIHENWRWQPWYRVAHEMIARGDIGPPIGYGFRFRRRDGLGDGNRTQSRLISGKSLRGRSFR